MQTYQRRCGTLKRWHDHTQRSSSGCRLSIVVPTALPRGSVPKGRQHLTGCQSPENGDSKNIQSLRDCELMRRDCVGGRGWSEVRAKPRPPSMVCYAAHEPTHQESSSQEISRIPRICFTWGFRPDHLGPPSVGRIKRATRAGTARTFAATF